MNNNPLSDSKYGELERILLDAMEQATGGKGKERHADGEAFEDQKICVINRWLKGSPVAGALFQAVKKTVESSRMTPGAAIRELYGAINYLAAGVRLLEEIMEDEVEKSIPEVNAEARLITLNAGPSEYVGFLPCGSPFKDSVPEPDNLAVPDEFTIFEYPVCADCFHMNLLPSDMPCKKCIDKPFRPHFTLSLPVYNKPPMPV